MLILLVFVAGCACGAIAVRGWQWARRRYLYAAKGGEVVHVAQQREPKRPAQTRCG